MGKRTGAPPPGYISSGTQELLDVTEEARRLELEQKQEQERQKKEAAELLLQLESGR